MVKYVKIRLEDEIHLEFRKMCLEAGTNMQQRLTDLIVRDIQMRKAKKQSIEDEGHEETNGHHTPRQVEVAKQIELGGKYKSYDYPQVKVTKPEKIHKRYKGKVGELLSNLDEKVKVNFDGDIETFFSYEVELVETE